MHFRSSCPSLRKCSFRDLLLSQERLTQGPRKSRANAPGQLIRHYCPLPNDWTHPPYYPDWSVRVERLISQGELVTICFKSQVIWTSPTINSWKMTFNTSGRLWFHASSARSRSWNWQGGDFCWSLEWKGCQVESHTEKEKKNQSINQLISTFSRIRECQARKEPWEPTLTKGVEADVLTKGCGGWRGKGQGSIWVRGPGQSPAQTKRLLSRSDKGLRFPKSTSNKWHSTPGFTSSVPLPSCPPFLCSGCQEAQS